MPATFVPFTEDVRQVLLDEGYTFILIHRIPKSKAHIVVPYFEQDKGVELSDEVFAWDLNSKLTRWIASQVLVITYVIDQVFLNA